MTYCSLEAVGSLAGTFVGGNAGSVRFQPEGNNAERIYPRSQVRTVVLGAIKISTFEGLLPGVPQYKRGQTLKGHMFLGSNLLSLATFTYGFTGAGAVWKA